MLNLIIDFDSVTIEAQVIMRLARISPMQWLTFWESARDAKDDAEELEELRDENKELTKDVARLENKLECSQDPA